MEFNGIHGIQWNSMEFHENFHGISWNYETEVDGIP
jgi:hypothetical protein